MGADSDTVTAIHRRVRALRAGLDPTAVARLRSGWLVMGDPQVLPGYCLLLPDPVVPHLNALSVAARAVYLEEMTAAGDVLLAAMGAVRINYAVFGNVEPALHAHLFPRCADEPVAKQSEQPWAWDWRLAPAYTPSVHGDLRHALAMRMIEQIPGACRTEGGC